MASPRNNITRSPLALTAIIIFVLGGILVSLSTFYADWLWFKSVGYSSVWSKTLSTKVFLFLIAGLLTSAIVTLNIWLAFKRRPFYVPTAIEADNLERYRAQIDPIKRKVIIGIFLVLFYFAGTSGAALWRPWLEFSNATEFGIKDPQFGLDVSFFAFKLPIYQTLISWGISVLALSLIAAAVVHYLYGGIRLQAVQERTSVAARVQLSVLLGLVVLLKAVAYWFDRYALALKESKLITGLTYTDVNAVLPAKAILAGIALVCAALFFANIVRKSWQLPVAGVALLAISSLLISGAYPSLVQQFQVKPSESSKEAPYIQRNIDSTRTAFGLDNVVVKNYDATINTSAGQLANDTNTIANIRLMDPNVLSQTFRQLQQIKPYYTFPVSLDIDRYTVNGQKRDAVVAVRELNIEGNPVRNWINDHLVYTHGFGFVAAYGNIQDADGKPSFIVGDLPPTQGLGKFEPRIYFGENVPDYSIIGGKSASPVEFDYPDDTSANGQKNYTYSGKGGVPVGSLINRIVFALKYQEQRILLSNLINSQSKILFERNPRDRVAKVAPWLTLDGDPYPALVNGKVTWIIDGYTTSAGFPYARKTTLSSATSDALTVNSTAVTAQGNQVVNYIRNSVKATVDAYDGTVSLYQWDAADPVFDFTNIQTVNFILPSGQTFIGEGSQGFPWDQAVKEYKSKEGSISSYSIPGQFFDLPGKTYWSYWAHEFGHAIGLPHVGSSHGEMPPFNPLDLMGGQDGPTRELSGWIRFYAQWLADEKVYCKEATNLNEVELTLVPLSNSESGLKLAIIPVSKTKAVLIESRRVTKFSCTTPTPGNGVLVYTLDATLGHGENFLIPNYPSGRPLERDSCSAQNSRSIGPVPDFLLHPGEKITVEGITIEVLQHGNYDKIKIAKN